MDRRDFAISIAVAGAMLLSGPALAQSGPASPKAAAGTPETVVVTAPKTRQDIETFISKFVDLHAAINRKTGQYMRDDIGPVCPVTLGLPQSFDDFISARVVQVASSVGARTDATGKCTPNIEILFTDQPKAVVKALSDRTKGAILGMHYLHETPRLLDVIHPIQGWYVTGTRMLDVSDQPLVNVEPDGTTQTGADRMPRPDSAYRNAPDRISTGTRLPGRRISSILNVLIVADSREVAGYKVGSISDYIAMLALSEPRSLDQCNDLPSILDLMSSACSGRAKPDKLTDGDMAYLKGLYAADLGATTNAMQKQSIQNAMEDQMGDRLQRTLPTPRGQDFDFYNNVIAGPLCRRPMNTKQSGEFRVHGWPAQQAGHDDVGEQFGDWSSVHPENRSVCRIHPFRVSFRPVSPSQYHSW